MAAMLFLLVCFMMKMMMIKSDAEKIITGHSGKSLLLAAGMLKGAELQSRGDVRWTNEHLVMSLKNSNRTMCHHRRCILRGDGVLEFTNLQREDAGRYKLEVFDREGQRLNQTYFLLKVEGAGLSPQAVISSVLLPLLTLLLLAFVLVFIVRRRRSQRRTAGPAVENEYEAMHSYHGNKRNEEEGKKQQEREEEAHYVSCERVVFMETQVTGQKTAADEGEDIYV